MLTEAQATVRNVWLLFFQRGSHVLNAILFAALVPRLMGPTTYGQYNLVTALALWFLYGTGLGVNQMVGRYVPEFLHREDREGLRKFVGQMAATRVMIGLAGGLLYFSLTVWWLQDLDWVVLGFMALSVFLNILGMFIYSLFLGLNQAALWGMYETLRRWVLLALVLAGLAAWGLRGACLGMALTDLLVLGAGLWWARPYLARSQFRVEVGYLAPYFRLGLIFFVSDIIMSTFQCGGVTMVWLIKGDYTQVSYFGLAYQGYQLVTGAFFVFTMAFIPLFAGLLARADGPGLRQWVEQLLKWLAMGGVLVFLSALFWADTLIPLVLGEAFRPVVPNLLLLTLATSFVGVASVGGVLAIIGDRPGVALWASTLRLAAFLLLGIPLVTWGGSLGGSLSILLATTLHAWYYWARLQEVVPFSLRSLFLPLALGGLFVPLIWLKSSWLVNLGLGAGAMAGYAGGLFLLGLVTKGELALAWQALVSRRARPVNV